MDSEKAPPKYVTATGSDVTLLFRLWNAETASLKDLFFTKASRNTILSGTLGELRRVLVSSPQIKQHAMHTFCTEKGTILPDFWLIRDAVRLCGTELKLDSLVTFYMTPIALAEVGIQNLYTGEFGEAEWNLLTTKNSLCNGFVIDRGVQHVPGPPVVEAEERQRRSTPLRDPFGRKIIPNDIGTPDSTSSNRSQPNLPTGTVNVYLEGIQIAPHTAFRYRERQLPSSVVSINKIDDTNLPLRIPHFTVRDRARHVWVETNDRLSNALVGAMINRLDIPASFQGRMFGHPIRATAGYGTEWEKSTKSATIESNGMTQVAYKFPRVRLTLDERCLELTPECKEELLKVRDITSLERFLNLYGEFYCTSVELGGSLFAAQPFACLNASDTAGRVKIMLSWARASLDGGSDAAFNNAASGLIKAIPSTDRSSAQSSLLIWSAIGGDTLLCNDPTAWIKTVEPYYNWGICEQGKVCHLIDLIGRMPGYEDFPRRMSVLGNNETQPHDRLRDPSMNDLPPSPPQPPRQSPLSQRQRERRTREFEGFLD